MLLWYDSIPVHLSFEELGHATRSTGSSHRGPYSATTQVLSRVLLAILRRLFWSRVPLAQNRVILNCHQLQVLIACFSGYFSQITGNQAPAGKSCTDQAQGVNLIQYALLTLPRRKRVQLLDNLGHRCSAMDRTG